MLTSFQFLHETLYFLCLVLFMHLSEWKKNPSLFPCLVERTEIYLWILRERVFRMFSYSKMT